MRILTGFIWDGKSGGIDAYLMAFARVAQAEGVQLDFLTNEYCEDLAVELTGMGHRLFEIATLRDRKSQKKTIRTLCEKNTYDAAYFNVSTALMYPVVNDARKAGLPKIAVHSHATGSNQSSRGRELLFDLLNFALRGRLRRCATHRFACSKAAATWLFGDSCAPEGSVTFVPNPVDSEGFAYDPLLREATRKELGLDDKFIVGSVTAMKKVKNPWLLVDSFAEFRKSRADAHLLVVGGGDLLSEVKDYAAYKLELGSFTFLGKSAEVPRLLQAFDVFMLTSKREGMPISVLEAQVSGLPCLISSGIPQDVIVDGACALQMKEGASPSDWAEGLNSLVLDHDVSRRCSLAEEAKCAGFCPDSPRLALAKLRQ